MRVYIALDNKNENNDKDKKEARIILMPVDANGKDLVDLIDVSKNTVMYSIGTSDMKCPYNCDNDALGRGK